MIWERSSGDVGNALFLDVQYGYIGIFFNNWLLYCTFYAIFTFHNVCYFIILNGLIKKESDYKEGKNERRNTCRQATIVDTQR